MHRDTHHDESKGVLGELFRTELLEVMGLLRDEVRSMGTDIREALDDRAGPAEPADRMFEDRGNARVVSEAHRVQAEVDALARRYEAASAGGARPRRATPRQSLHDGGARPNPAWLKKMMMMMLIAELD